MKTTITLFLWLVVFVIMWVAVTKLDEWGMQDDAKHKPVFHYNPYVTHS